MGKRALSKLTVLLAATLVPAFGFVSQVQADSLNNGFSVLITPSPIVATVNPGKVTNLQLKVLNNGFARENLSISPKSFSVNNNTGQVSISSAAPSTISSWLSFSAPNFSIADGQWFTENIRLNVPKNAGFSYYFALNIANNRSPSTSSGRVIKASVDDFVLLNVNRPGAKASLSLISFKASKHIYQWLPASFSVRFKNTGNTIIQPSGNVFIKRSANSKTSIDVLNINNGGYILPGTDRIFTNNWLQGFPEYLTTTNSSGVSHTHLSWTLSKSSSFRFGEYNASLVAVYNNGSADVPLTANVSFWVLPWVFILIALFILIVFIYGFWSLGRQVVRSSQKNKNKTK